MTPNHEQVVTRASVVLAVLAALLAWAVMAWAVHESQVLYTQLAAALAANNDVIVNEITSAIRLRERQHDLAHALLWSVPLTILALGVAVRWAMRPLRHSVPA